MVVTAKDRQEPLDRRVIRIRVTAGDGLRRGEERLGFGPRHWKMASLTAGRETALAPRSDSLAARESRPRGQELQRPGPRDGHGISDRRHPQAVELRGPHAYHGCMTKSMRVSGEALESCVKSQT